LIAKGVLGDLKSPNSRRSTNVILVLSLSSATQFHFSPSKTLVVFCFVAFET